MGRVKKLPGHMPKNVGGVTRRPVTYKNLRLNTRL